MPSRLPATQKCIEPNFGCETRHPRSQVTPKGYAAQLRRVQLVTDETELKTNEYKTMKNRISLPKLSLAVAVLLTICASAVFTITARAQDYGDPSARVARLNFVQGDVTFQPGGEGDWVWAGLNRPLTNGDSLWTERNSRAELHVGSTAIRIGQETAVTFLNVDDNTLQIQLNSGSMNLHVRSLYDSDVIEIDTPNLAFTVRRRGNYRITAEPDGYTTLVAVREGEGQIDGGGQAFLLEGGSQAQVSGTDSLNYEVYDLSDRDSFDQWAGSRDQREDRSQAVRYVSPEMTGYEDLDRDGSWRNDPNYGNVWVPTSVSQDWAPYRQGHWAWVSPWGWTWVDDQPFGFVTSHYGRWAHLGDPYGGGGWAWIPPRRDQNDNAQDRRPVYSPALVVFAGDTSSFGGGLANSGGMAWFPLAPGEAYLPAYKTSNTYITNVNITNTTIQQTNITNIVNNPTRPAVYANQKVAGAVTAVPKAVFVNAQPVAQSAVKVSVAAISAVPIARTALLAPIKTSVTGPSNLGAIANAPAHTSAQAPAPPAAVVARPVVAKVVPPPPPVPFVQKQKALDENPGKPLDPRMEQSLRAAAPAPVRVVKAAPPVAVVKAPVATPKPATSMPSVVTLKPKPPVTSVPPANSKLSVQAPGQVVPPTAPALMQQKLPQQEAEKMHQQQMAQQAEKLRQEQQAAQQDAEKARQPQAGAQRREPPQMAPPPNQTGLHNPGTSRQPVRVPENVQEGKLVFEPRMETPADAKGGRSQGTVHLRVLIGSDGKVKSESVLSGPLALQEAALQNARQRQYQPTLVNNEPVEVETEISVKF